MQLDVSLAATIAPPLPPMAAKQAKPSPATNRDSVAYRLRITRLASGMTQAQFCRLTGIGQQAWNNYESGYRPLTIQPALRLCNALGVTLDWLYRGISAGLPFRLAADIQRVDRDERTPRAAS
jgi:transcriptional regulator with XRE-family HTH domain